MSIARYIDQKTEQLRRKQIQEARARSIAEDRDWRERKLEAERKGEPFDEPHPSSEEAERIRREAIESSFLHRLKRHWMWPHLVIFFWVCVVVDLVALGYGIVWLVKYVAGIEGSGTVFWITMASLLLVVTYRLLYRFIRWWYR